MSSSRDVSVLFVCTANICRSPFMELWSRHVAGPGSALRFSSAGTQGYRDAPMAEEMRPALERVDLDVDSFRSRRLTAAMVAQADLVLTAERSHRTFVLDDSPGAFRKVLTLGQAASAVSSIPAGVHGHEALAALSGVRASADRADDVDDPYRRGPEAAEACAERVTAMLSTLLPVLDPRGRRS